MFWIVWSKVLKKKNPKNFGSIINVGVGVMKITFHAQHFFNERKK